MPSCQVGLTYAWNLGIVDEVDRVGATSVFGDGNVLVVWLSRLAIVDDLSTHVKLLP